MRPHQSDGYTRYGTPRGRGERKRQKAYLQKQVAEGDECSVYWEVVV